MIGAQEQATDCLVLVARWSTHACPMPQFFQMSLMTPQTQFGLLTYSYDLLAPMTSGSKSVLDFLFLSSS